MDEITIISKTQKALQQRLQDIGDVLLAGGVDTMEKYRYLVGQAHGIQLTLQDISNLLNPKEQKMSKETLSTLKKEAPKIKFGLQDKYEEENKNLAPEQEPLTPENIGSETVDELPTPSGYRLLVLPFTPKINQRVELYFLKNH